MSNIESVRADLAAVNQRVGEMPVVAHRDAWSEVSYAAMDLREHLEAAYEAYVQLTGRLATARTLSGQFASQADSVSGELHQIVGENTHNQEAQTMLGSAGRLQDKVGVHMTAAVSLQSLSEKLEGLGSMKEAAEGMSVHTHAAGGEEPTAYRCQDTLSKDIEACRQSL